MSAKEVTDKPRRPGRRRPLFGDARADMALARADMSARNNLKLNAFVTLVYQKPGRAIRRLAPHRVISSAGSPLRQAASGVARRAADAKAA